VSASAEVVIASRWQPRRPQPRGEQRRQRLLEALERQLHGHRFAEVSIADVAEAAGLGRSAFYFYFSSKHDAVTQLLGDVFDEEIARVAEILYGPGDPQDNIADGLGFIVESWRQRRTLLCAMLDARDGDAEARLIWEHWLGRYEDFAADYISTTAVVDPAESRILAHVLIAMNERVLERHVRCDGDRQSADELHGALVRVWRAALRRTP
jgi:TetR/AcrR family transcriptional regulator, ethionamide resistance regulator